jgi:hypothetical protein
MSGSLPAPLSVPVEARLAGDRAEPVLGASNRVLGEAGGVAGAGPEDLCDRPGSFGEESAKPDVALETWARWLAIEGGSRFRSEPFPDGNRHRVIGPLDWWPSPTHRIAIPTQVSVSFQETPHPSPPAIRMLSLNSPNFQAVTQCTQRL